MIFVMFNKFGEFSCFDFLEIFVFFNGKCLFFVDFEILFVY